MLLLNGLLITTTVVALDAILGLIDTLVDSPHLCDVIIHLATVRVERYNRFGPNERCYT